MKNDWVELGNKVLSPALSHYTTVEIDHGNGCYLYDREGQEYLDFSSGLAVCATGHCHPKVVKAIQDQAAKLIHTCAGVTYYAPNVLLGKKLQDCLGMSDAQFFFTQSGSEANEAAIKLAKYTSKKTRLLAFQGGFHGRTLGALSATTSKMKYREGYEPLLPGIDFLPFPYLLWTKTSVEEHINQVRDYLEKNHSELAAVIIEPALGEGGYVPAPKAFIQVLRQLCTQYGVLLIFDEVQTGVGRTGHWFAFQHYGVEPDIIAMAKGLGSGMPIGAVAARKSLMEKWTPGAHGGTFTGNPVTCAAALATLDVIESVLPELPARATKIQEYLETELRDVPAVAEVRVFGYMIGIEFVDPKDPATPSPNLMNAVMKGCLDHHLFVLSCGIHGNVIRVIPPLIIDEPTLLKGLRILTDVIRHTH